jgi:hypothetical protein
MAKDSNKINPGSETDMVSDLPGGDNSKVIPSSPFYIKEGLQFGIRETIADLREALRHLIKKYFNPVKNRP